MLYSRFFTKRVVDGDWSHAAGLPAKTGKLGWGCGGGMGDEGKGHFS